MSFGIITLQKEKKMGTKRDLEIMVLKLDIPSQRGDLDDIENIRWLLRNWRINNRLDPLMERLLDLKLKIRLHALSEVEEL